MILTASDLEKIWASADKTHYFYRYDINDIIFDQFKIRKLMLRYRRKPMKRKSTQIKQLLNDLKEAQDRCKHLIDVNTRAGDKTVEILLSEYLEALYGIESHIKEDILGED